MTRELAMPPLRLLLLLLCLAGTRAETLTLVADPWCPYNCQPGSDAPGFMVEIARTVFAAEGIEVEYVTLPWVRVLQAVEQGEYDAAIGASRVEAPELVFPGLEQGRMRNAFWTRRDSDWHYRDPASLGEIDLAAIAGYGYGPVVENHLNDPANEDSVTLLYGATPLRNGLNMLDRGRIDVLLEDEHVFRYAVRRAGRDRDFRLAGRVTLDTDFSNVYIAFSPALDRSPRYARLLAEGTARLRASGELARILASYGVLDWRDTNR